MSDYSLNNKRAEAVKCLMDQATVISFHRERSKLAMLDWLLKEAVQFFQVFGYESEYARKLMDSTIRLASLSDPLDRNRIINALSELTDINVSTLKAQVKEVVEKMSVEKSQEVMAGIDCVASKYPLYEELKKLEGAAFSVSNSDNIQLNQQFFVRKLTYCAPNVIMRHFSSFNPVTPRFLSSF